MSCRAVDIRTLVALILAFLLLSLCLAVPTAAQSYRIGTVPPDTAWGWIVSEGVRMINENTPYHLDVQETGGTRDNALRMNHGELEFGFIEMLVAHEWYRGIERFEGRGNPDARLVYLIGSTAMHWAVTRDSGIETWEDLQGQPFNPSTIGGGGEYITEKVFSVLGIEPAYRRMHIAEAAEAVKEGTIVGLSYNGTPPVPLFSEVHSQRPLRLLSLSDEQVEKVLSKLPFLFPRRIPAESYQGIREVQTIGIFTGVATTSQIPEDVVYELTRAYWENRDQLAAMFEAVKEVNPRDIVNVATLPLHAGALRYYREIGLDIPDELVPPEAAK